MKKILLLLSIFAVFVTGVRADDLRAAFTSAQSYIPYYVQNFDSEEEFSSWTVNTTNREGTWELAPGMGYNITFDGIDPDNKNSLTINYSKNR